MSDDDQAALDAAFIRGQNSVWTRQLKEALFNLDSAKSPSATWAVERAEVVAALRSFCDEWGDNDWPDNLHLSDVIEKHLMRHIESNATTSQLDTPDPASEACSGQ
jgi:hypothetical protein